MCDGEEEFINQPQIQVRAERETAIHKSTSDSSSPRERNRKSMDDPSPSPTPSSSLSPAAGRRFRIQAAEEEDGGAGACTGKSCQSCTAGVIADCVAVCCCPCAVVNIFVLAFFKLPWAVARRCLRGRSRRSARRMVEDGGGIPEKMRAELEIFGEGDVSAEEVWLELSEVGHLGFGRVSFTGITFRSKGS